MLNIIDLIAILVVLVCAIFSFKRGFIKTFFGFVSTFLAIIVAFAFCDVGVEFIKNNTEIDEWIEMTITNAIESKDSSGEEKTENTDDSNIKEEDKNLITNIFKDLPQNMQEVVEIEEYKENTKKMIVQKAVPIILKVLSWVLIYFVTRLVLWILCIVFDGIMNIPFLKQINNITGLVLGAVLGVFRVYIVLAFISFLVSVIPMQSLVTMIKNSLIVSTMYENNLLINLIF